MLALPVLGLGLLELGYRVWREGEVLNLHRGDVCLLLWGSLSPTGVLLTVGRGLGRMQWSPDRSHLTGCSNIWS